VSGLEALRGGRPGPHRQHLQPDDVRHDARLRDVQRGAGVGRPGLLGHRLDRDAARRPVLPVHQGRAEQHVVHAVLQVHPRGEGGRAALDGLRLHHRSHRQGELARRR
ncbi:hypothetical protein OXX69_013790, partial [Metschnikowia pulcherrima]